MTVAKPNAANTVRYSTSAVGAMVTSKPIMAVNPQINTKKCSCRYARSGGDSFIAAGF